MAENNNCDGSGPHASGVVKVMRMAGDSNGILCKFCWNRELAYRIDRNKQLEDFAKFALPLWDDAKVYGEE